MEKQSYNCNGRTLGQNKLFRKNNGRVKKGETDMGFLTGKTAIITGG